MRTELLLAPLFLAVPLQSRATAPLLPGDDAFVDAERTAPQAAPLLSWSDVDGDGLEDVVTRDARGALLLLHNLGTGGFEDATASWGLGELGPIRGALWLSLGEGRRAELLVLDDAGCLRLFRHAGTTLEEVTASAGLGLDFAARHLQWADVDHDGRLDLVASGQGERRLLRNLGELAFEVVALPPGPSAGTPTEVAGVGVDPVSPAREAGQGAAGHTASSAPRAARSNRASEEPRPRVGVGPGLAPAAGPATGGTPQPLLSSAPVCVSTLEDQASGNCLQASSIPTLGRLFPLSTELNVDAAGQVGVGTVAPLSTLHVSSMGTRLQASALTSEDLIVEEPDAVLGLYSWGGGNWGSVLTLGELDASGALQDKWSIARLTDTAGSALRFTHGNDPSYAANPTHLTLQADGGVGIGTTSAAGHQLRIVKDAGAGSALDATNAASGNSDPAIYGYHKSSGPGVEARTLTGEYAFEGNGMSLTKGAADYALRASNTSGTAAFFDGALEVGAPEAPFFSDVPRIILSRDATTGAGRAVFRNGGTFVSDRVVIEAVKSGGTGSAITMRNGSGVALVLDTNHLGSGKSRVTTDVLEITGGADLVEHFDAGEDGQPIEPGTVLVIDPERPGRLRVSSQAYDRRVAGIVSGAGGIDPGLSMGQTGVASGDTAVALTGRVYVRATCEAGSILPGDRLTTSSRAGLAMRVDDEARAGGAVLGKAMSALDEGTGLVLVLVNLH